MRKYLFILTAVLALASCSGKEQAVTRILLSKTGLTLAVGGSQQLQAVTTPQADVPVSWSSSNPAVATVSETGLVSAVSQGEATVTASVASVSAACLVTVTAEPVQRIVLSRTAFGIEAGESVQLRATVEPSSAPQTVTWISSNPAVASVSETGLVTGVKVGVANILATAGDQEAICQVSVQTAPADGDFYYADGTWSPTLYTNKTPIGVVFWVGDPAGDDPSLKADFPACTHGLVVSLREDSCAWSNVVADVGGWCRDNHPEYFVPETYPDRRDGDYLNKKVGYNNTKVMGLFNAAHPDEQVEVVSKAQVYNVKVPAPEGTSGWYVPSAKELSLLSTGEYDGNIWEISAHMREQDRVAHFLKIRDIIDRVSGSQALTETSYWTSFEDTEYLLEGDDPALGMRGFGDSGALVFSFAFGDCSRYTKSTGERLRYILAF